MIRTVNCELCGQPFHQVGQFGAGGSERFDKECSKAIEWARRHYRIWGEPLSKPTPPLTEDPAERALMEELDRRSLIWLQQKGWAA